MRDCGLEVVTARPSSLNIRAGLLDNAETFSQGFTTQSQVILDIW